MHPESDHATRTLTGDSVTEALRHVAYPGLTRDLVSFGMVEDVRVRDGHVTVRLGVHTRNDDVRAALDSRIRAALLELGASSVAVELVAPKPSTGLPVRQGTADPWAEQVRLASVRARAAWGRAPWR